MEQRLKAQSVTPRVFHLATTTLSPGVQDYLDHIGASAWETDTDDEHAELIEIAGRTCYRSFGVGLNKNVTKVREGNKDYIGNGILGAHHGSVIEHCTDTFALVGVSRILTHEMVRHRQGTAFSQESGRYVRIDQLQYYDPYVFNQDFLMQVAEDLEPGSSSDVRSEGWIQEVRETFREGMNASQHYASRLEKLLGLDNIKSFGLKKKLQSAIRRIAPNGQSTTLIMTANHRAWRHIVSMRTASQAEEEIRIVQAEIFRQLERKHPNIYQDAVLSYPEDAIPPNIPMISFINEKV